MLRLFYLHRQRLSAAGIDMALPVLSLASGLPLSIWKLDLLRRRS